MMKVTSFLLIEHHGECLFVVFVDLSSIYLLSKQTLLILEVRQLHKWLDHDGSSKICVDLRI